MFVFSSWCRMVELEIIEMTPSLLHSLYTLRAHAFFTQPKISRTLLWLGSPRGRAQIRKNWISSCLSDKQFSNLAYLGQVLVLSSSSSSFPFPLAYSFRNVSRCCSSGKWEWNITIIACARRALWGEPKALRGEMELGHELCFLRRPAILTLTYLRMFFL